MDELSLFNITKSSLPTVVTMICKDEEDAKDIAIYLAGQVEDNSNTRYHQEEELPNKKAVAAVLNYKDGEAEILLDLVDKES